MTTLDLTYAAGDAVLEGLAWYLIEKANRLADEIQATDDLALGWRLLNELDDVLGEHRLVMGMLDAGKI